MYLFLKTCLLCLIFQDRNNITIKSLVIQSSKVSDMPHEITGKLHIKTGLIHIGRY